MRIITILANILLLLVVLSLSVANGFPSGIEFLFAVSALFAPAISLLYTIAFTDAQTNGGWLKLFLKRKALEERKKIESLEK